MPWSDTDYVAAEGASNMKLALKAHRAVVQPTGTKTDPRQRSTRKPALLETSIAQTQVWQHPGSLTDADRQGFGAGLDHSLITASDACHVSTIRLRRLAPTGRQPNVGPRRQIPPCNHTGRYPRCPQPPLTPTSANAKSSAVRPTSSRESSQPSGKDMRRPGVVRPRGIPITSVTAG
jgi:hypothetical protein